MNAYSILNAGYNPFEIIHWFQKIISPKVFNQIQVLNSKIINGVFYFQNPIKWFWSFQNREYNKEFHYYSNLVLWFHTTQNCKDIWNQNTELLPPFAGKQRTEHWTNLKKNELRFNYHVTLFWQLAWLFFVKYEKQRRIMK